MAFLPKKFAGTQEQLGSLCFPSNNVTPLVDFQVIAPLRIHLLNMAYIIVSLVGRTANFPQVEYRLCDPCDPGVNP